MSSKDHCKQKHHHKLRKVEEVSFSCAVNSGDFSGSIDASINCSLGSEKTLFSTTFSEISGNTISASIFSTVSNEGEKPANKDHPVHQGPNFTDEMHSFDQHKSEQYDQLQSIQPKVANPSNDFKSCDNPSLGSENTLFSTTMSNHSMGTISSDIFSATSIKQERPSTQILSDNKAESSTISSGQEYFSMSSQPSNLSINSSIFSHSVNSADQISTDTCFKQHCSGKEYLQLQQKSSSNSHKVHFHYSETRLKANASLLKQSTSFPLHEKSTVQLETLANSLDSLDANILLVSQSHDFIAYCASNSHSKAAVKVLRHENDSKNAERLKNEHEISCKMSHPNIRKSVKLKKFQNQDAIVLEWVEGKTLSECGKFGIKNFLLVAAEILQAINFMHSNFVIHKNLTADHIVVNFCPLTVKIIGCSLSDEFNEKNLQTIDELEGDLSYISPEKTGKVN